MTNEEILLLVDGAIRQYGPYGAVLVASVLLLRMLLCGLATAVVRLTKEKPLAEEIQGILAAIEQADGDAHGRLYRGHLYVEQDAHQQLRLYLKTGERFEEITQNFSSAELRRLSAAVQQRQKQLQAAERAAMRALAYEAVQHRGNANSPNRKN